MLAKVLTATNRERATNREKNHCQAKTNMLKYLGLGRIHCQATANIKIHRSRENCQTKANMLKYIGMGEIVKLHLTC